MKKAADELIELNGNNKVIAGFDCTWSKRGFHSTLVVMTACSPQLNKVLDSVALSKYWHICKGGDDRIECECTIRASSGSMEKQGALVLFKRSVKERGIEYTKYLGDGDTNAYKAVVEAKSYGENTVIKKVECINHIAKFFGRRVKNLKQKTIKLNKSKSIKLFGVNGINPSKIKRLQNYYGKAIRDNIGDPKGMKKPILATYYHHAHPNAAKGHKYCSSWCWYKNNEKTKRELMPAQCMKALKQVYDDMSSEELLERCKDGLVQNVNEVNGLIWRRFPKSNYSGLKCLRFALADTIICFNYGYKNRANIITELGFIIGKHTEEGLQKLDLKREINIKKKEKNISHMNHTNETEYFR